MSDENKSKIETEDFGLMSILEEEAKGRTKSDEPNKYILFDETTVKIGDKTFKMRTDGIETIQKIFGTTNGKKLAKIFLSLALAYKAKQTAAKKA
jgi:hypothetical protein